MFVQTKEDSVVFLLQEIDPASGSWFERLIFNNRPIFLLFCFFVTLFLSWQAMHLPINANYVKMMPLHHPFVSTYLKYKEDLGGIGNSIRVIVEARQGTIFNKDYLNTLREINDELYLIPGVDRPFMKSLWTTSTRWTTVTENGLEGGTVIPEDYDGSADAIERTRVNIRRSSESSQLVAKNFKSSALFIPILDVNQLTGEPLNYQEFNANLERIRTKYQNDNISIRITGFAKIVGDLIDGLKTILKFFVAAVFVVAVMLFWFTRCVRSTLLVLGCSLIAVVWQFGIITVLDFELDPYSILVPFLIFAIGISHCAQKMNGIMQNTSMGMPKAAAARCTFRRLFTTGLTALLCDAVGFMVLMSVEIQVIQDLAMMASIGVVILIITNLILLPVLLSYVGVSQSAARHSLQVEHQVFVNKTAKLWQFLLQCTQRSGAMFIVVSALFLGILGYVIGLHLQVGDINPGAPELRSTSRYNQDNAFMVQNYATSSDIFVVMVKTAFDACTNYKTLSLVDELGWKLEQVPGVESTFSMANRARILSAGYNEGNFKWLGLSPNNAVLSSSQKQAPRELKNFDCSLLALHVYLHDHKAETLTRVTQEIQQFIDAHPSEHTEFLLAAGNAGIEAATNSVVKKANRLILFWIYSVVVFLCWLAFRSWRAVVVAVIPLILTSILCEAFMVIFDIGIKVATLPVISLGVGIGVDYALYMLTIMLVHMREGKCLSQAYYAALRFTGKVVVFTALTLSMGVGFWVFSPIKFQADMGILLALMFVWNMIGALVLLPALSYFMFTDSKEHTLEYSMSR
ncbi:MAG: MMPL family transporter [Gammaproteobacteria bacterium]